MEPQDSEHTPRNVKWSGVGDLLAHVLGARNHMSGPRSSWGPGLLGPLVFSQLPLSKGHQQGLPWTFSG